MKKGYERFYARIDLDAVRDNFEAFASRLKPGMKRCAVIKADAYGHGAFETADAILDLADFFAVAIPEEALALRKKGIDTPVLVLGVVKPDRAEEMILQGIRMPVTCFEDAKAYSDEAVRLGKKAYVHFKIDTGMGRIGFPANEETVSEIARIGNLPGIEPEGIFTHLATADMTENEPAKRQQEKFMSIVSMLREKGVDLRIVHFANSAASILFDTEASDMVRIGISLYGLLPSDEADFSSVPVRPVMSLYSEVSFVKTVPAGTPIGYGGTFVTKRESRIATISCGYADGYPRTLSNKGSVLIRGIRCPIVGRICMDQMMVDITDHPEAGDITVSETVVLMGESGNERLTAEELGDLSGRFNYEFVCDISRRVPRVYVRNGITVSEKDWFYD